MRSDLGEKEEKEEGKTEGERWSEGRHGRREGRRQRGKIPRQGDVEIRVGGDVEIKGRRAKHVNE
eukprot:765523-Hanusia_phi.AAC.3